MKYAGITSVGVWGIGLLLSAFFTRKPADGPKTTHPGFAVVELFTSEGCSSCPPADQLANELVSEARENNRPVYVLSFHVDYWNRLGWKDPFSTHAATERQYWYADLLKTEQVYTPQMVVNGTAQFVGSRKDDARKYVEAGLRQSPEHVLTLSLASVDPTSISFTYAFDQTALELALNYALVEKGLASEVRAGENRGRQLRHESVVRYFQSLDKPPVSGMAKIKYPVQKDRFEVIAYLQNRRTGKIISANKLRW